MGVLWVLAAVAVLGGVAMVAAGRGTGLAPAEPDRPDVFVPTDRPVGKSDVDEIRFSVGLRGYRMDEVDDLLDRLASDLAARDARIAELEQAAVPAEPHPGPLEPTEVTTSRTLIVPVQELPPAAELPTESGEAPGDPYAPPDGR